MIKNFLIFFLTVVILLCLIIKCGNAQMTVDPQTCLQISWDGGGSWTPVEMVNPVFSIKEPSKHAPFIRPGMNDFEVTVDDVWAGDPNTLLEWQADIQIPSDAPETIFVTFWFQVKILVQSGDAIEETEWSEMQTGHIRTPKKPKKPRVLKT